MHDQLTALHDDRTGSPIKKGDFVQSPTRSEVLRVGDVSVDPILGTLVELIPVALSEIPFRARVEADGAIKGFWKIGERESRLVSRPWSPKEEAI